MTEIKIYQGNQIGGCITVISTDDTKIVIDYGENLPGAELIIHDVNEEIPGLIAQGEADVMITEILEAGYYCAKDDRLAAPLINDPFTRGQLGALLPNGSEELLEYVNVFIAKERESGRLEELAQQYIYGKDVEAETIPSSDPVPALQP